MAAAAAAGLAEVAEGDAEVGGDAADDGLERLRWAWCGCSAMGGVGVAEGGPKADAVALDAAADDAGLLRLLPAPPLQAPALSEGWPGGVWPSEEGVGCGVWVALGREPARCCCSSLSALDLDPERSSPELRAPSERKVLTPESDSRSSRGKPYLAG